METLVDNQQKQSLNEELERASAFEELIRTKGWEFILAYFQNRLQRFTTDILNQEDKDLSEFEGERRELMALRKLFGTVNSSIETLKNEREKGK